MKFMYFLHQRFLVEKGAPSPVEGCGICEVKDAKEFYLQDIRKIGEDVQLTYRKEVPKCLQEL